MPDLPESPFLTVAEVAGLLRVTGTTVRRMVDNGELRGVKVGKQVRVYRDEVDRLVTR